MPPTVADLEDLKEKYIDWFLETADAETMESFVRDVLDEQIPLEEVEELVETYCPWVAE